MWAFSRPAIIDKPTHSNSTGEEGSHSTHSSTPTSSRTRSKVNRKEEKTPSVLKYTVEKSLKPKSKRKFNWRSRRFISSPDSDPEFGFPLLYDLILQDSIQEEEFVMAPKEELTADILRLTSKLQRIQLDLNRHEPAANPPVLLSAVEVSLIIDDLKVTTDALESIDRRTYRLYTPVEIEESEGAHVTTLENSLKTARTIARTLKAEYDLKQKSSSLVKREALPLPKFDGDSSSWSEFKDQFEAAFHNDSTLAPSVKLQNLKNLMVPGSTPSQILSGFQLTDANYSLAYKALHDRYEKTRELAFSYLRNFTELPFLQNPNGLQAMIDTITTTTQKLNTLNIATTQWDPFLVFLIYDRLDPHSRREFERSHPDNAVPTLQDVLTTLRPLAAAHEATQSKKTPSAGGVYKIKQ
jgi:Protein of unknown function (DUF1759)